MLSVLPAEVTLSVLTHLPIPSLLSLPALSHQWLDFFTIHESEIFHHAAIFHEYIKPEILLLEDALSSNEGKPWTGATTWKDFCKLHMPHTGHLTVLLIIHIVKATGRFNFAKIGRERGTQLPVCCHPRATWSIALRLTKRPGYASRPTYSADSP